MTLETWTEVLVKEPRLRRWPKYERYVPFEDRNRTRVIKGEGRILDADLADGSFVYQIGDWGTRLLPATEESLLELARIIGLTAHWVEGPGGKWAFAHGRDFAPPKAQEIREMKRDVEEISAALHGYQETLEALRSGIHLGRRSRKGHPLRAGFERIVGDYLRTGIPSLLSWSMEWDARVLETSQHFALRRPPSLREVALAHILSLHQAGGKVVKKCENPDCGRRFVDQSPRGGRTSKSWARPDLVRYCSHECAKHAAYLRSRTRSPVRRRRK
jgi:hypothetical protein